MNLTLLRNTVGLTASAAATLASISLAASPAKAVTIHFGTGFSEENTNNSDPIPGVTGQLDFTVGEVNTGDAAQINFTIKNTSDTLSTLSAIGFNLPEGMVINDSFMGNPPAFDVLLTPGNLPGSGQSDVVVASDSQGGGSGGNEGIEPDETDTFSFIVDGVTNFTSFVTNLENEIADSGLFRFQRIGENREASDTYIGGTPKAQTVPEPGTVLSLLAIGGLGLSMKRKKHS